MRNDARRTFASHTPVTHAHVTLGCFCSGSPAMTVRQNHRGLRIAFMTEIPLNKTFSWQALQNHHGMAAVWKVAGMA